MAGSIEGDDGDTASRELASESHEGAVRLGPLASKTVVENGRRTGFGACRYVGRTAQRKTTDIELDRLECVGHTYPLTAPEVRPATIWRLNAMYISSGGMVMSRMFMKRRFHCVLKVPWKL